MSGVWRKTLVYLGLVEEPEEHDDLPQRFDQTPRSVERSSSRSRGSGAVTERRQRERGSARRSGGDDDRDDEPSEDTVRPLRFPSGSDSSPERGGSSRQRTELSRVRETTAPSEPSRSSERARQRSGAVRKRPASAMDGADGAGAADGAGDTRGGGGGRGEARVRVVEVNEFDDCEDIGRAYRSGHPVVFDLGGLDTGVGRRVLDFVSGMTFGLRGSLDRAGERAFLLVPDGVSVPEEERHRLDQLGFEGHS